jgi:hypothetical protein
MELKFVPNTKPGPASVAVQRRQRLVRRIDQQIAYCGGMRQGQTPRAAWVWMDDAGAYFVPIRYGKQPLELKKGMFAVRCKDLGECESALTTIRAMVLAGDFDDQLAKAAGEIRKRFSG